jgi:hypothetical protein
MVSELKVLICSSSGFPRCGEDGNVLEEEELLAEVSCGLCVERLAAQEGQLVSVLARGRHTDGTLKHIINQFNIYCSRRDETYKVITFVRYCFSITIIF